MMLTCELTRRRTVRTADAVQGLEACDGGNGEGHEDVVDLGNVDLAPDALVRLDDLHAGEAAQGHGLANDGECGRYHRLHNNSQRSNGEAGASEIGNSTLRNAMRPAIDATACPAKSLHRGHTSLPRTQRKKLLEDKVSERNNTRTMIWKPPTQSSIPRSRIPVEQ